MELNDDVVLRAVQARGGAFPVTPEDLLNRRSERLIFESVEDVFVPPDALEMIQRSIDRLAAAGYVAGSTRYRRSSNHRDGTHISPRVHMTDELPIEHQANLAEIAMRLTRYFACRRTSDHPRHRP